MTPEQLEQLVACCDKKAIAFAVENMPESERKKLSKHAAKIYRDLEKAPYYEISGDNGIRFFKKHVEYINSWLSENQSYDATDQLMTSRLAVLAFCPLSITKKIDARFGRDEELVIKILMERRPEWIDKWVDEKLKGDWATIEWDTLRYFIKKGLCKKPDSEAYFRLLISKLPDSHYKKENYIPLSEKLLAEPDILDEDIWNFFTIETYAFANDWGHSYKDCPHNYESWPEALCRLSNESFIDRQRLLDGSIDGLSTGFKNNILSGYINFHDKLKPTIDELSSRQKSYMMLLGNQAPHVVTFALKVLKKLEKHNMLDDQAFIDNTANVFTIRTKTQPKTALLLLKKIVTRNAGYLNSAAKLVIEALSHESPDIQEFSLSLLEDWSKNLDSQIFELVIERREDVAAVHRSRFELLLRSVGLDISGEGVNYPDDSVDFLMAELRERVKLVDERYLKLSGIDNEDFLLTDSVPAPMEFDIFDVQILSGIEQVNPIQTIDELIDVVSHAVEEVDSAEEIERILDGISRLSDQRPDYFDSLTEPLLKRVNTFGSGAGRGIHNSWGTLVCFRTLINTWLRPKSNQFDVDKIEVDPGGIKTFQSFRIYEIVERVSSGKVAPLLSAPTHVGGWVDPLILVERIEKIIKNDEIIPIFDLCQAFLRLAPDNRDKALIKISQINYALVDTLFLAFGQIMENLYIDQQYGGLWLSAARSMYPSQKVDNIFSLPIENELPDGISPAIYNWKSFTTSRKCSYEDKIYRYGNVEISSELCSNEYDVMKSGKCRTDEIVLTDKETQIQYKFQNLITYPTVLLHVGGRWSFYGTHKAWLTNWIEMSWLQNKDPFLVAGIKSINDRMEDKPSNDDPNFAFLNPLFETDRPLTEVAYLALIFGLVVQDTDVKGYALDALAETIQDGRFHYLPASAVLIKLVEGGWVKLNRLSNAFSEVSRLSTMHSHTIVMILDKLLAAQKELARDGHHILAVLLENCTDLGLEICDESKDILRGIKGSGKAAKLTRALLNLEYDSSNPRLKNAIFQYWEARVVRAVRWQQNTK